MRRCFSCVAKPPTLLFASNALLRCRDAEDWASHLSATENKVARVAEGSKSMENFVHYYLDNNTIFWFFNKEWYFIYRF